MLFSFCVCCFDCFTWLLDGYPFPCAALHPFQNGRGASRRHLIQGTFFNNQWGRSTLRSFPIRMLVEVTAAVHFAAADQVLVAARGEQLGATGLEATLHVGVQNFNHGSAVLPFRVICHGVLLLSVCLCLLYTNSFRLPCLSWKADIL